jgi:predicted Fe-Mo cluster-binding NifX family protein
VKVCISSTGKDLDANVDQRFGRCKYFVLVDTDTMEPTAVPNEGMESFGGSGIQASQTVIQHGAKAVVTGNVGPNAFEVLKEAGIKVYTGATGTVADAIAAFRAGALPEAGSPTVQSHAGIGGPSP